MGAAMAASLTASFAAAAGFCMVGCVRVLHLLKAWGPLDSQQGLLCLQAQHSISFTQPATAKRPCRLCHTKIAPSSPPSIAGRMDQPLV
jgi:hypothetical protein